MILSFVLIILCSPLVYAEDNFTAPQKLNIMEVVLFLNSNQANNGSASLKADYEKKTLQYFDQEGKLMEESHIDANNDIVTKKFDPDGNVILEIKITEESILDEIKKSQTDHKEKEVPELKSKLTILAKSAEHYAQDHDGHYPKQMQDLVNANPPYLTECFCDDQNPTYKIVCDINETGYKFKAKSLWPHHESYLMTNGEKLETLPPDRVDYEKLTSTCK